MSDNLKLDIEYTGGESLNFNVHPEGMEVHAIDANGIEIPMLPDGYILERQDLVQLRDYINLYLNGELEDE